MANNNKRICYTCGKEYRYCSHCAQYKHLPTWMNVVCSEECKDIYQICGKYNIGKYTKVEAAKLLDQYNVAMKSFYNETINKTIAEIYGLDGSDDEVSEETTEVVAEVETVTADSTADTDAEIKSEATVTSTAASTATSTTTTTSTKKKTRTTKSKTATLDE